MKNRVIAKRYAKALLLISKGDGQTERYREELNTFLNLLKIEPDLESVINNPIYSFENRRRILAKIVESLEFSNVMRAYLLFLFEKGRIGFLNTISVFFQKLADELKGIARASLVSATELSSDTIEKIRLSLSARTGKEIILEVEKDPGLIGGIVTRIGDLVLDGSVKTQLLNMKESLKRSESV